MVEAVFWRIKRRYLLIAFFLIPITFVKLKFNRKVSFFKVMGTGKGESFSLGDADLFRYGAILVRDQGAVIEFPLWRRISKAQQRFELLNISAHGKWSGKEPFTPAVPAEKLTGKVAAITRARIKLRHQLRFWKSLPPVMESLHNTDGLIDSFGIGELPIGLQGTFSIWESEAALKNFAYQQSAHKNAIKQTKEIGWYSEELFARFIITSERSEKF